ncbi:MAG: DEAD/DEAH box helicase [Helicobacteraceae bacterium]|jgi:ATP-dependent RNA helicase RhlE|nr:DEAD/DEAH box helicase [Helicobacteraceae bacterium]
MPEQTEQPTEKIYYDPISIAKRTQQKLYRVADCDKVAMLVQIIKSSDEIHMAVITKTKREADALSVYLKNQDINAASVHGSKRVQENEAAGKAFDEGELAVLITTDMILQSLELLHITHMVSFSLPSEPEHYLNRVGCLNERGEAIAFVSEEQEVELIDIERVMRHEIPEEELEGFEPSPESDADTPPKRAKNQKKKPRHRKQKRKTGSKEKDNVRPEDEKTE